MEKKIQEKIEELKKSREEFAKKLSLYQQEVQAITVEIVKIEGAIREFELLIKKEEKNE